jgi:hypothetical protein
VHFTDCVFSGNDDSGLFLARAINTRVIGCDVRGNAAGGIEFSLDASDVQIIGGQVRSNGTRGISVVLDSGKTAKDIIISGVSVKDNSAAAAGTNSGIRAAGPGTVTGLVIEGCRIGNDGTSNQQYGISTESVVTRLRVIGNDLTGNATGGALLADEASSRYVTGNNGYKTSNTGTASIASGATSATVTHGLDITPVASKISITFTESPSNDPGNVWVSSIGASTFVVNCRADPGASNLDFSWSVNN